MSGIAEAIGKPTSTISRMIGRTSVPTPETVGQVAQLLRVEPEEIWRLLGRGGREGLGRWNPPEAAHDFDGETRDVLNRLIRVLAKGEQGWSATGSSEDERAPGGAGEVVPISTRRRKFSSFDLESEAGHFAPFGAPEPEPEVTPEVKKVPRPKRGTGRAARRRDLPGKSIDDQLDHLGEETQEPEKP